VITRFVLNRLPVFLGKSPCFREKNREARESGDVRPLANFKASELTKECAEHASRTKRISIPFILRAWEYLCLPCRSQLAGSIELISAVGLTLGLFTRPVALVGSVYLLMSMLLGGHFRIGYVWALPEGGYEFGMFWAVMVAVFAVLGGGRDSVDRELWQSEAARRLLPSFVWKVLAS
jgi:uncharacterized membrane protein YphA (DoxX/SURF4 family)